jgi:hypothetical protein
MFGTSEQSALNCTQTVAEWFSTAFLATVSTMLATTILISSPRIILDIYMPIQTDLTQEGK